MSVAVSKIWTWDDLKDLAEGSGRTEIVDGDLAVSPPPSDQHQEITTALMDEHWIVDPRNESVNIWWLDRGRYISLGSFGRRDKLQTRVLNGLDLGPIEIFTPLE